MKTISYHSSALKTLKKMPRDLSAGIQEKVRAYASDAATQANNVKALKGRDGGLRLRVGDWRVVMMETDDQIIVARVAPRGSVYD